LSASESEGTSIDDSVPGLGSVIDSGASDHFVIASSSNSEDTNRPPSLEDIPLEVIRRDLADWVPGRKRIKT
jgi:hypothetical protein